MVEQGSIGVHAFRYESFEELGNDIAVTADDAIMGVEFEQKFVGRVGVGAFGEGVRRFDLESEPLRQRLDRLDAANIGTRNDPADHDVADDIGEEL